MKSISVGSALSLPEFSVPTSDPNYWSLRADYEYCCTIQAMRAANIEIQQIEVSDFEAAETAFNSLSDYARGWFIGNVNASCAGEELTTFDKSYIPELLELFALIASGQWGLIYVLFVKVGLEFIIDWLEKGLDPDTNIGGGGDDMADLLKQIFAVLDPDGKIIGSRVDGLSKLHITINNTREQEDHIFTVSGEEEI